MKILLIRTKKGLRYAQHIQSAVRSLGMQCFISDVDSLDATLNIYGLNPSNTLIHSRTAGVHINKKIASLEKKGFHVINSSRALILTNNKYLAQKHAEKNGIPVAKTYKVRKNNVARMQKLLAQHGSLVLKPIFSQGQGIYCAKVEHGIGGQALAAIAAQVPGTFIQVQERIDYKKLIRMIVINYTVLTDAATYDEPSRDWKCSVCLNPAIKKYTVRDAALVRLGEETARAFGARINYIDFFEDARGQFILNEINTACSLFFHEKVTGVPIADVIARFLVDTASAK